jgi:hypothetical protein
MQSLQVLAKVLSTFPSVHHSVVMYLCKRLVFLVDQVEIWGICVVSYVL